MKAKDIIIVALDVSSPEEAIKLVDDLWASVYCFKIGLQFITAMLRSIIVCNAPGPNSSEEQGAINNLLTIRYLFERLNGKIFWDGKFDDIPNTIAGASKEVVEIGVKMFNIHASCGIKAMRNAVAEKRKSIVLAVTVLTSLEENNANLIFGAPSKAKVLQFARDAKHAGCGGIICSSQELKLLRGEEELDGMLMVNPGIRPEWFPGKQAKTKKKDDQSRKMTPYEAIKAGADHLVIGRPITQPPEEIGTPVDAVKRITEEIEQALEEKGD